MPEPGPVSVATVLEETRSFVLETFLKGSRPAVLTEDTLILDGGLLDSIATLELIVHLEERYGIRIGAQEVTPATFGTLGALARFVANKVSGA